MSFRVILCVCSALICTPALAQWWNPFAPSDYEECAESAAKTAKTNEALKILVQSCGSKFAGRRKPGGGYTFYDPRQDQLFDIKGPNPSADEQKRIDAAYSNYVEAKIASEAQQARLEREWERERAEEAERMQRERAKEAAKRQIYVAELDRRAEAATSLLRTKVNQIQCLYPALETCDHFDLTVTITNTSKETVTSFVLGWTFVAEGTLSCPSSIAGKTEESIRLRPNENTVVNIKGFDGPKSLRPLICVRVTAAKISP
ncbi:hypothetical protein [Bradyrhizobium sp. SZCCHNR1045]|uniref:hypothetical protein n=1 Tax=Bradyrhizobium sp. SZCCHNR1045 TaxID=3057353 RepID=UPI0029160913|nr:hypothetical protein [Bradyrhizobium sp. SZCCHNR1045]